MNRDVVIVTGLSGAGLSSALKVLEDQGYEVLDNFPVIYIAPLIEETKEDPRPLALGVDTRTRGFSPKRLISIARDHNAKLVFLTADNASLQKRFSETRRRHPLAKDRPVSAGITRERRLLAQVRSAADLVIDTGSLSIHDLRRQLEGHFSLPQADQVTITLISFGFRNGVPGEADIVMDVRFLKNPNWVPELKPQTGLDNAVGDYIEQDSNFQSFLTNFKTLLLPLLPCYKEEGKNYLTVAIGCTGGHHRSVYSVACLAAWLEEEGYSPGVVHRDIMV